MYWRRAYLCFMILSQQWPLRPVLRTVDYICYITCRSFPVFTTVLNYTTWWQRHNGMSHLPEVVIQQCPKWELVPQSLHYNSHTRRYTSTLSKNKLYTYWFNGHRPGECILAWYPFIFHLHFFQYCSSSRDSPMTIWYFGLYPALYFPLS